MSKLGAYLWLPAAVTAAVVLIVGFPRVTILVLIGLVGFFLAVLGAGWAEDMGWFKGDK